MSKIEASKPIPPIAPPLSWPPPGLERLQGRLWLAIGLAWTGGLALTLPLLWALAVEQPFYSLGPFEDNWGLGVGIAALGALLVALAFAHLFIVLRQASKAADTGYGALTIVEVACDSGRDTGFLIQGKRHFGGLDEDNRVRVVKQRLRGALLLLAAAVWLVVGFGVSILLAARGFVTSSGIGLLTLGPTAALALVGGVLLLVQNSTVRELLSEWEAQEGANRVKLESASWNESLALAGAAISLGAGPRVDGGRFRALATAFAVAALIALAPTVTVAVATAIGPILAEIAVPTFLSVQEMAGASEVLRRYQRPPGAGVSALEAGRALQSLAFVGSDGSTEPLEQPPATLYAEPWFPNPDVFPAPSSEGAALALIARPLTEMSEEERLAMLQAAGHPAQAEFDRIAGAGLVDVVSGRWRVPFPDTVTFAELPWPRFQGLRLAGLARVAKAAVDLSEGREEEAERTLHELVTAGFLLVDQGPTLLDNLVGVELVRMGGDGLEGYYRRLGRDADAEALAWARSAAADAADKARAGIVPEDLRGLLQGIPDLVENEEALRGLRWEYFATFNMLAPCINLQKMVFGPGDTLDEWRRRAERSIVRVPGEQHLFDLAEHGVLGTRGSDRGGFLAGVLKVVLGAEQAPGSCAALVSSLQP